MPPEAICYAPNCMPHHAKHCSVACKYLKIIHAANAAHCMTSMFLATNAAHCTPHAPKSTFYEPAKIATGIIHLCSFWIKSGS
jgi:hypothetical protein